MRPAGIPDDRRLAGWLALGPPLSTTQRDWLEDLADQFFEHDDPDTAFVGGLMHRVIRLERQLVRHDRRG